MRYKFVRYVQVVGVREFVSSDQGKSLVNEVSKVHVPEHENFRFSAIASAKRNGFTAHRRRNGSDW